MPNQSNNVYGLSILSPLKELDENNQSVAIKLKKQLLNLKGQGNPMCKVPNTYLARFYVLEDVFYEDYPSEIEHLKSKYLVFTTNFYGDLDTYLEGMYENMEVEIKSIWKDCYGFDASKMNVEEFKKYIKKCQVETTFLFDGSTDDSLNEQLKSLYLKQELSKFAFENAHKQPKELMKLFKEFIGEKLGDEEKGTYPKEEFPRWKPAGTKLDEIVDKG